jgi:dCTP deaminase
VVLSRPDILEYLQAGKIRFEPSVSSDRVKQVSIDLRLGHKFTTFKNCPGYLPAIVCDSSLWESADLWKHEELDSFKLEPGHFVLAHTLETVTIPNDLVGLVEGRSSFARIRVTIHLTAPKIDPGFSGTITLEMANFGKERCLWSLERRSTNRPS